jgi:hypothetical protein
MRILLPVVAFSLLLAGAANAQPQSHGAHQSAPHATHQGQQAKPGKQQAGHMAPKHWKRGHASYQSHVRACQQKYRSYNPRTDRYSLRGGKTALCRL